jgi:hypothetical protein
MLMIRPIQKRILTMPHPQPAQIRAPVHTELEAGAILESSSSLVQRNLLMKKQLAEFVKAEPESSITAVRAWLREETP